MSKQQKKTAKERAEEERRERQMYRELISDLDWWSKYYVTKEDAVKVCRPSWKFFYSARDVCC